MSKVNGTVPCRETSCNIVPDCRLSSNCCESYSNEHRLTTASCSVFFICLNDQTEVVQILNYERHRSQTRLMLLQSVSDTCLGARSMSIESVAVVSYPSESRLWRDLPLIAHIKLAFDIATALLILKPTPNRGCFEVHTTFYGLFFSPSSLS